MSLISDQGTCVFSACLSPAFYLFNGAEPIECFFAYAFEAGRAGAGLPDACAKDPDVGTFREAACGRGYLLS